ncbi:MAG: hypothetical protein J6P84_03370 [Alphaproteobacteria bacterium]|nr:hypothetical protein [Alphaproteobacteria bacterium]
MRDYMRSILWILPIFVLCQCTSRQTDDAILSRALRAKEASDDRELSREHILQKFLFESCLLSLMEKHKNDSFPLAKISESVDTKGDLYKYNKAAAEIFNEYIVKYSSEKYKNLLESLRIKVKYRMEKVRKNRQKEKNNAKS